MMERMQEPVFVIILQICAKFGVQLYSEASGEYGGSSG